MGALSAAPASVGAAATDAGATAVGAVVGSAASADVAVAPGGFPAVQALIGTSSKREGQEQDDECVAIVHRCMGWSVGHRIRFLDISWIEPCVNTKNGSAAV